MLHCHTYDNFFCNVAFSILTICINFYYLNFS
jgi:hypothetical protein